MSSNPVGQLSQMYTLLENNLRRKQYNLKELRTIPEIKKTEKSNWQVRDLLKGLVKRKYVLVEKKGATQYFIWDKDAPPFVLAVKLRRKADKVPSEVSHIPVPPEPPKKPKEFEFLYDNVQVTIIANPKHKVTINTTQPDKVTIRID